MLITSLLLATTNAFACEKKTEKSKCVQVLVYDNEGKAVSDMVVYLQPLAGQKLPVSNEIVTISQQKQAFSPNVSVSQLGNKVNFENKDDITHHIYSVSSKDKFAFKVQAETAHISEPFKHEAEIAMGCNIHDWMSGSLLVVDTPYFGKTDKNGKIDFSIEVLGQYQIIVWHPQLPLDQHRVKQDHDILNDATFNFILPKKLDPIPTQSNDDSFDFVSDY